MKFKKTINWTENALWEGQSRLYLRKLGPFNVCSKMLKSFYQSIAKVQ